MPLADLRYEPLRELGRSPERATTAARDRLTGASIVLKSGSPDSLGREFGVHLALPPGVAPTICDALWTSDQRLVLALEHLSGETLGAAAGHVPPGERPALVFAIADALAQIHRGGVIHADLSPENIFLLETPQGTAVRLLDFGFAFGPTTDAPLQEQERGATPGLVAPELLQGWIIDERVDQFSLAATLRACWPELERDSQWAPLIEQLSDPVPARRFPEMAAVCRALASRFALPCGAPSPPRFPAGALRGRRALIEELCRRATAAPGTRLLLQARPGVGLTRLLLEALGALAAAGARSARIIDLATPRRAPQPRAALALMRAATEREEILLCGVADPSPDLRGWPTPFAADLRDELRADSWKRIAVLPLEASDIEELLVDSLGGAGEGVEQLAAQLAERTAGDLHLCAQGFATAIARAGEADGLAWNLDPAKAAAAIADWDVPPYPPSLHNLPTRLRAGLQLCARAGPEMPRVVAQGLIEHCLPPEDFHLLCAHGLLAARRADRVAFATERLWRESELAGSPDLPHQRDTDRMVDAWLHEHWPPDPARTQESARAARRAASLDDVDRQAAYLAAALQRAYVEQRWGQIRILLAYPDDPPTTWALDPTLVRVRRLHERLRGRWSRAGLLLAAARGIRPVARAIGDRLLAHLADGHEVAESQEALILLLDHTVNDRRATSRFEAYAQRLEAARPQDEDALAGVLDFYRAQRALGAGETAAAGRLARRAAERLRGSGRRQESLSLQMLAILGYARNPEQSIAQLHHAVAQAPDAELEALLRRNLSLMHARRGDPAAAAACAEQGIHRLWGRVSLKRLTGLRIQRALAWAYLDYTMRALDEAQQLQRLVGVRRHRDHRITVRLLLGTCLMVRHASRAALREIASAWEETAAGCNPGLRSDALRCLIEAILDREDWSFAATYADRLRLEGVSRDNEDPTVKARAGALHAQATGDLPQAAALLTARLAEARALVQHLAAARFLHHLGVVHLELAREAAGSRRQRHARIAGEFFGEETGRLVTRGHGYYRARALLGFARARALLADPAGAATAVNEAVEIARRSESLGLLTECLQARVELRVSSDRGAGDEPLRARSPASPPRG